MKKYLTFIPIIGLFLVVFTNIVNDMYDDTFVFVGSAIFQGICFAVLLTQLFHSIL